MLKNFLHYVDYKTINNLITSLPDNLTVGGNLDLRGALQ